MEKRPRMAIAVYSHSSTKAVVITVVPEETVSDIGAVLHPTMIETRNGITVLVSCMGLVGRYPHGGPPMGDSAELPWGNSLGELRGTPIKNSHGEL